MRSERLQLEVGGVSRHRQDANRVCMAKASLPSLHGNYRGVGLDDLQLQGILKTKADAVVDLLGINYKHVIS